MFVIGVASNANDELFVTLPGVIQELLPAYKKVSQSDYYFPQAHVNGVFFHSGL